MSHTEVYMLKNNYRWYPTPFWHRKIQVVINQSINFNEWCNVTLSIELECKTFTRNSISEYCSVKNTISSFQIIRSYLENDDSYYCPIYANRTTNKTSRKRKQTEAVLLDYGYIRMDFTQLKQMEHQSINGIKYYL